MSQRQRAELGNLPVELSSFVGRTRELAELRRHLSASPVVTLTGPGGIGKTRLAVHAAHWLARSFPDGVWMVELAGLDGSDLPPHALARAIRLYERPDHSTQDTLLDHLRDKRLLLVIDNCEHVLEAGRELVTAVASAVQGCGCSAPAVNAWASPAR